MINKKLSALLLIIAAIFIYSLPGFCQVPTPTPKQTNKVLILNAVAHLGNGKVIENSAIAFENGKITLVADARTIKLDMAYYDEIIHAEGKHIYPGIIAPNSTLGISEVGAVRATRDYDDVGKYNPHVRSIIAYNAESNVTSTVRTNGVLIGQITPRGGRISGTSSIVQFDAWNWEDAVIKIDDGIHVNWPRTFQHSGWWAEPGGTKKNEKYHDEISELTKVFSDAKAYHRADNAEQNIRQEAMGGLWSGNKTLFIHTNYVKDIENAILFARQMEVKKIVIVGGYDSWMLTDMLKENNVAVMLTRVHSLPQRPEDDIDLPYKLPYLLQKEGVLFCLQNAGDMEAMNARNIPFLAGTAVAYGLTKEEALQAITGNSAKILGIDSFCGTLEVGKDATLFLSTGDALDMMTNNVELAYIQGRNISLDNSQKRLYEKYKAKYAAENVVKN
ncbi:MAG: amidohydrolase family protein [Flavobacteriales bacterium]|nr:amidohydrolase family protein [Flavobacteriales bacterium]